MVKGKWMVRRLVGDLVVSNHCECILFEMFTLLGGINKHSKNEACSC